METLRSRSVDWAATGDGIARMVRYRLCYINPHTKQVDREREIAASDDVDAIHIAGQSDHRPLQLWCGDRKVQTFGGTDVPSLHA